MKLMMPKDENLTPRQQAAAYFAEGFTWDAAKEMAGYDEEADMRKDVVTWTYAAAGFAVLCYLVVPSLIKVLS